MTATPTADVVSAQFPCGAAWLANALLELQVALPELWGFDTSREWRRIAQDHDCYAAEDLPWRQTLAALRVGREFKWRTGQRVRFTHAFPWQLAPSQRCVLMVRDPRDALHSEWRRHQRNHGLGDSVDLPAFAASAFWGSALSQVDWLWLHFASWLSFAEQHPTRALLLRFEDCKSAPLESLRAVTRFLAISTADQALRAAVEASDVRHLQIVERALSTTAGSRVFNRAGIAFEWQNRWSTRWHAAIGPHWNALLSRLDYRPTLTLGAETPLPSSASLLAGTGVEALELRQSWHDQLLHWRE